MSLPVVTTEDGSLTCPDVRTGELYHNRAGAYTEALLNYVRPSGALETLFKYGKLKVLDSCFGLGYNTWVLLAELLNCPPAQGELTIIGLDNSADIWPVMPQILADLRLKAVRTFLDSQSPGGVYKGQFGLWRGHINKQLAVTLDLRQADLRQAVPNLQESVDLVFHDGFSPKQIPELWTADLFAQYYRLLALNQGRLLTYSSAAAVTAGLLEAGFSVYRTQGVGGKSGGRLAVVTRPAGLPPQVFALSAAELDKLKSRAAVPYRDPDFNGTRDEIRNYRRLEAAK